MSYEGERFSTSGSSNVKEGITMRRYRYLVVLLLSILSLIGLQAQERGGSYALFVKQSRTG